MLCIYFILHIQLVKSDNLQQQRNCSNELDPLLNLVSDQGKKVVLIPEGDQISVEHITPHFDVEPCDLHQYRENLIEKKTIMKEYLQNIYKKQPSISIQHVAVTLSNAKNVIRTIGRG